MQYRYPITLVKRLTNSTACWFRHALTPDISTVSAPSESTANWRKSQSGSSLGSPLLSRRIFMLSSISLLHKSLSIGISSSLNVRKLLNQLTINSDRFYPRKKKGRLELSHSPHFLMGPSCFNSWQHLVFVSPPGGLSDNEVLDQLVP